MLEETAKQRSETLKNKWKNPEFAYRMMKARYGEEKAKEYIEKKHNIYLEKSITGGDKDER